jgi:hypothetical protein
MTENFLIWCGVLVAVEALTELISSSAIMFPIRDWFSKPIPEDDADKTTNVLVAKKRSVFKRFYYWLRAFIGELLNCGYCTSVWVAGAAAFVVPGTIPGWPLPTILMKWLVLHRLSNLLHESFRKRFRNAPFSFVFTHIHNNGDTNGPKES